MSAAPSSFAPVGLEPRPDLAVSAALERARDALLEKQRPDGHWIGELQGDTILESEYIFLMAFLGREDEERLRKAAKYILAQQRPEGGWSNYPGGPLELSVSVKAYFALKLTGHDAEEPAMRRAREAIRAAGGAAGSRIAKGDRSAAAQSAVLDKGRPVESRSAKRTMA